MHFSVTKEMWYYHKLN